jgi:hypothetical protein
MRVPHQQPVDHPVRRVGETGADANRQRSPIAYAGVHLLRHAPGRGLDRARSTPRRGRSATEPAEPPDVRAAAALPHGVRGLPWLALSRELGTLAGTRFGSCCGRESGASLARERSSPSPCERHSGHLGAALAPPRDSASRVGHPGQAAQGARLGVHRYQRHVNPSRNAATPWLHSFLRMRGHGGTDPFGAAW